VNHYFTYEYQAHQWIQKIIANCCELEEKGHIPRDNRIKYQDEEGNEVVSSMWSVVTCSKIK